MKRILVALFFFSGLTACVPAHVNDPKGAEDEFLQKTGLHTSVETPKGRYLAKNHAGYEVLFRAEMGDVWGRYAARLAMGEIGRELGPVGQFLTGSHEYVGTVVGSPLDRLLSRIIGQPLTFFVILRHDKPGAPRLDIVSDFSTVTPEDRLPKLSRVGFSAGSIYSDDISFADRISSDRALIDKIAELRSQYIRVDDKAVTFIFAGSERDWSAEIREHGGYAELVNSVMDILVGIANKI